MRKRAELQESLERSESSVSRDVSETEKCWRTAIRYAPLDAGSPEHSAAASSAHTAGAVSTERDAAGECLVGRHSTATNPAFRKAMQEIQHSGINADANVSGASRPTER